MKFIATIAAFAIIVMPVVAEAHGHQRATTTEDPSVADPYAVPGQVMVQGYYMPNGTFVAPHMRTAPDASRVNNWTTQGNFNPYTGRAGTRPAQPVYNPSYYVQPAYVAPVYRNPYAPAQVQPATDVYGNPIQ